MNALQRDEIRKRDVIRFHDRKRRAVIEAIVTRRFRDGKLAVEEQFCIDPDNGEPIGGALLSPATIYASDVTEIVGARP